MSIPKYSSPELGPTPRSTTVTNALPIRVPIAVPSSSDSPSASMNVCPPRMTGQTHYNNTASDTQATVTTGPLGGTTGLSAIPPPNSGPVVRSAAPFSSPLIPNSILPEYHTIIQRQNGDTDTNSTTSISFNVSSGAPTALGIVLDTSVNSKTPATTSGLVFDTGAPAGGGFTTAPPLVVPTHTTIVANPPSTSSTSSDPSPTISPGPIITSIHHASKNSKLILPISISAIFVVLVLITATVWCKVIKPRQRNRMSRKLHPFPAARAEGAMNVQPQPREKFAKGDMVGYPNQRTTRIDLEESALPTGSDLRVNDFSMFVAEEGMSMPLPNSRGQQPENELLVTMLHRLATLEAAVGPVGQTRAAVTMEESQWEDQPPDYVSRADSLSERIVTHPPSINSTAGR